MQHKDHVNLIKDAIGETKGFWADLGSGEGAFTLALADVTNQEAEIFSIDKDKRSLEIQKSSFETNFPNTKINFINQDFSKPLPENIPLLDGIIMANSLHYIKDQKSFLENIKKYLKPGGKFVLVEYNSEKGNIWVPYTVPFSKFERLMEETGFTDIKFVASVPSQFLREIYCAFSKKN